MSTPRFDEFQAIQDAARNLKRLLQEVDRAIKIERNLDRLAQLEKQFPTSARAVETALAALLRKEGA